MNSSPAPRSAEEFDARGYELVESVLERGECRLVRGQIDSLGAASAGERSVLAEPWCRSLAQRLRRHFGVARRLPRDAMAVQCTLFAKSPDHNWLVALHQDLAVPVRERVESAQTQGWSEKEGMIFVQPRLAVLEQLVAVRLHLDDCTEDNGAVRIVPGSHRFGRLAPAQAQDLRSSRGEVVCAVRTGGVLLMRPLLLHASSKSTIETPRRVLHFVFGPPRLPDGLTWHLAV
ncbi:MAG TPA: phytanoyl-CoA dioxygenase family protein [Steroidobacteraceae bacterium]|nr:phytanoyl-CoA dioxygenase family protein [Steroidobacteraceae bacterium]